MISIETETPINVYLSREDACNYERVVIWFEKGEIHVRYECAGTGIARKIVVCE